jgi:hypothetical protein
MALPMAITAGSGPWWAGADATASSLQITSVVAARAWVAAAGDPAIAHPANRTNTKTKRRMMNLLSALGRLAITPPAAAFPRATR